MSTPAIKSLHLRLNDLLATAAKLVQPGCYITLVIRNPALPDGDILLTDEPDIENAIASIKKMKDREPIR